MPGGVPDIVVPVAAHIVEVVAEQTSGDSKDTRVIQQRREAFALIDKRDDTGACLSLVRLPVVAAAMLGGLGLPFPPFILLFPFFGSYLTIWLALNPRLPVVPAARFGDFSYGLYIYGWPSEQLLAWLGEGRLGALPLLGGALVLSLILSAASWHLVEKRALRLKPRPRHSDSNARPAGVSLQTSQSGFSGLENQGSAHP